MILAVDIGNSNIVLALFEGRSIIYNWRIITEKNKSADEYEIIIKQLFSVVGVDTSKIKGAVISSVVPEVNAIFKNSLNFLNVKIISLGDKNINFGVKISDKVRSNVGQDILMNILSGKIKFKENFIIVDMGTAITFDIAVKDGEYVGSIIAPGVNLATNALHSCCSLLPLIDIKKPEKVVGKNTEDVMRSGVYYGYIGLVKEIISRIKGQFCDIDFRVYLTGGLSSVFVEDLDFIDGICPNLTIEGINAAWYLNNEEFVERFKK